MALTPNHAKPVEHLNPHLQKVQHLNALPLLSLCTTVKKVLDNREDRKNRRQTVRGLKKRFSTPDSLLLDKIKAINAWLQYTSLLTPHLPPYPLYGIFMVDAWNHQKHSALLTVLNQTEKICTR